MLAICRIPCLLRTASVNLILKISLIKLCRFLYNLCNTYIHTDMLATCRIPCPLRTASECYIYTYLDYLNFLYKSCDTIIRMDMLAPAVSHVRCAPQV